MSALKEANNRAETMVALARKSPIPSVMNNGGGYMSDYRDAERAKRQYNQNTGYTFASIRPIAVRCAKQAFRVGRIKRGESKAGNDWIKNHIPGSLKSKLAEKDGLEILPNHPFNKIVADPNEFMTEWALKYITTFSIQLTGKGFWWMTKDKSRAGGYSLWPIPSHWVRRDPKAGNNARWIITPPGQSQGVPVGSDEMAYFYYPDPMDPFNSRGPMDAAKPAAETSEMIRTAQRATFDNIALPAVIFKTGLVPGEDGKPARPELSMTQKEQIEQSLKQLYRGVNKWGRMMILDKVIEDVTLLNQKPFEMDFQESGKMTKDEIMQIFGVNPIVAGQIESANRASALVAVEAFLDNVVNPLLTMMSEVIDQWVIPALFPNEEDIMAWIEEAKSRDPDTERADLDFMSRIGAVLVDEVRAHYNYPPLPDGRGQVIVRAISMTVEPLDGPDPAELQDLQLQQQQLAIDGAQAANDGAQAAIDQAKDPPRQDVGARQPANRRE